MVPERMENQRSLCYLQLSLNKNLYLSHLPPLPTSPFLFLIPPSLHHLLPFLLHILSPHYHPSPTHHPPLNLVRTSPTTKLLTGKHRTCLKLFPTQVIRPCPLHFPHSSCHSLYVHPQTDKLHCSLLREASPTNWVAMAVYTTRLSHKGQTTMHSKVAILFLIDT